LRIYQTRKEGNRHLVDVRIEKEFPANQEIEQIRVLTPVELIVSKIFSYQARRGKPKSGTDWRDITMLLLRFPELKEKDGEIAKVLSSRNADGTTVMFWKDLVDQDFSFEDEDSDLSF